VHFPAFLAREAKSDGEESSQPFLSAKFAWKSEFSFAILASCFAWLDSPVLDFDDPFFQNDATSPF
jgi:hypothetical protein